MVDQRKILEWHRKGVKTIVTHMDPHPDEIVAILLARSKPGLQYFPGADTAPIETWSKSDERLQRPPDALAQEGCLLIGIGGSPFDEHATEHGEGKPGCASTLMAKLLGFDKVDQLRKFLKHIERNDNGQWGQFDLATAVMQMYDEGRPTDSALTARHQHRCVGIALHLFSALVNRHLRFLSEGAAAFAAAQKFKVERRGDRRVINIAVGVSDAESFPRYARSERGNSADIVIVKSPSTGCISILTVDQKFDLTPLARALRMRELYLRNQHRGTGWEELSCVGVHPAVPEWYLHDRRGLVLNKSRVRPDAPPTQIPLEDVVDMTEWVVGGWLPEFRDQSCVRAQCCFWEKCSVYALGLPRCRDYRRELAA